MMETWEEAMEGSQELKAVTRTSYVMRSQIKLMECHERLM